MTKHKSKPIVIRDNFLMKETPFDPPILIKIQKSCIWERRINNSGNDETVEKKGERKSNKDRDDFLLIGFDSEFKTPQSKTK